jgi:hypothetical protein
MIRLWLCAFRSLSLAPLTNGRDITRSNRAARRFAYCWGTASQLHRSQKSPDARQASDDAIIEGEFTEADAVSGKTVSAQARKADHDSAPKGNEGAKPREVA